MNLRTAQAELIVAQAAELAAHRAYLSAQDPKPGPEHLFRKVVAARVNTELAAAEHRFVMEGLVGA